MWTRVLEGALQCRTTALRIAADGAHRASSSDRATRKLWIHEGIQSTSWWKLSYFIQNNRNWTRTAVFEQRLSLKCFITPSRKRLHDIHAYGVRRLVFAFPVGVQNFPRLSIYYSFCRSKLIYICLDAFAVVYWGVVSLSQTNSLTSHATAHFATLGIFTYERPQALS